MDGRPGTQPLITGATRLFAIIGDPIAQVKSPEVLNPMALAAGRGAVLIPLQVPPPRLVEVFAGLRAVGNLDGLIITVPHKMRMRELVDEVLPTGQRVGAINVARREPDGRWVGDMFDGRGFVTGLRAHGCEPRGKQALLVGAGGAGSAVGFALAEAGVVRLTVFDVDRAKADRLAQGIASAYPAIAVAVGAPDAAGYDLVVNATPIGMKVNDPSVIDPAGLRPGMFVGDVIILPQDTPLLAAARQRGCAVMGGKPMVEGQAALIARFIGMIP